MTLEILLKDTSSGAMEMAAKALDILADAAREYSTAPDYFEKLKFWARELASARPSMAPIGNALGAAILSLNDLASRSTRSKIHVEDVINTISSVKRELEEAKAAAATRLVEALEPFSRVMTISKSSTILSAFRMMKKRNLRVVVAESRPLFEGRETAKTLASLGFPVVLIADAAMAQWIGEVDIAVIGADAILKNGTAVNKVGSHLLALAAKEREIPFYVACEGYKLHPADDISFFPLEEAIPEEIFEEKIQNIEVRNYYFEDIPSRLISKIILETGMFSPDEILRIMENTPPPMLVL